MTSLGSPLRGQMASQSGEHPSDNESTRRKSGGGSAENADIQKIVEENRSTDFLQMQLHRRRVISA